MTWLTILAKIYSEVYKLAMSRYLHFFGFVLNGPYRGQHLRKECGSRFSCGELWDKMSQHREKRRLTSAILVAFKKNSYLADAVVENHEQTHTSEA